MATNIRDGFISPQVWVAKRETKVIEVLGKLTPARVEYAENIFGNEKYKDGNKIKKDYSVLTMAIFDGKGDTRKTAKYNFNPNDFFALRRECASPINAKRSYVKELTKKNLADGVMTIRTVTIRFEYYKKRNGEYELDSHGQKQESKYPWYIGISNRTGVPDENGVKIQKEISKVQTYMLLNSDEYQAMIDSTCRYIDVFAMAFGPALLREKRKQALAREQAYRGNNDK